MERLFTLLLLMTVVLILAVGGGVHWLSSAVVNNTKEDAAHEVAKAVALSVSQQLYLLNKTLDNIAQQPEVISALSTGNTILLESAAKNIQSHFPEAIKIRLLTPDINKIDESTVPNMGYADLDMVRETLLTNQSPVVQGDSGVNRHLAMTSQVRQGDRVVGVILASLDHGFIAKTIKATTLNNYYIELRQAKLVLGISGTALGKTAAASAELNVPHSDWKLYYEYPSGTSLAELSTLLGILVLALSVAVMAVFLSYRKLSRLIKDDLSSVLKAFKDIVGHKSLGSYPVSLAEMNTIIASFLRLNRALDDSSGHIKNTADDDNVLEENGFFSAPDSAEFVEITATQVKREEHVYTPMASLQSATYIKPDLVKKVVNNSVDNEQVAVKPASIPQVKTLLSAEIISDLLVKVPVKNSAPSIFKAYDIRGIVGTTLTMNMVYDIGRAFGTEAKKHGCKTVAMGRDGRTSSPVLAEELAKGIASTGCNIMDIGMIPTPVLYFATQHLEGRCGIMVTGSHNPPDYNGFKMVIAGETLAEERIQALKACIDTRAYSVGDMGLIEKNIAFSNEYIGTIADDVRISRPMLVVLDCGNGVGGKLGPTLLRTLGCEVIELHCDIDGSFPNHHPDPSKPENMHELMTTVKHYKADVGIAFDGDADRLGVVDSNGKIIWPDRQMMLFAKHVLAANLGAEVLYDVKCSTHLATQIKKYGGRPQMWKSGHSLMKAKIKATGAKLAGEMSGHIFFNDRWFGFDDGLYAAARLIEILSNDQGSSAQVFASFPDSVNTPELTIELAEDNGFDMLANLRAAADFADASIIDIDGLRVEFVDGWGLVRASNTTPALTLRFEGDTLEAMQRIQQHFKQLINSVNPDLVIPF